MKKYKKQISYLVILIVLILLGILLFNSKTYSSATIQYREEIVCKGDTLWNIANNEIENNKYFQNKDTREVVYELKKVNNLSNAQLYEGQKILIPKY